ncbi:hypothetical protein OC861_000298 [Tilletia horrida]|nr:hypothetical protein OC861_000298 [Tilletia horrida]
MAITTANSTREEIGPGRRTMLPQRTASQALKRIAARPSSVATRNANLIRQGRPRSSLASASSSAADVRTAQLASGVSHPKHASSLIVRAQRRYSTAPNREQVASTFGRSFVQFILTLSKAARITVYTALVLVLLGATAFEGTHQYVERKVLPRVAQVVSADRVTKEIQQLLADQVSEEELACFISWIEEAQDEAWTPPALRSGGTDPRLGIRGRHALRSAFIAAEWGSGTDPSFLFNHTSFFGQTTSNSESSAALQRAASSIEQGLQYAEQYLLVTLYEAERKGLRLPEPAVQRAKLLAQQGDGTGINPTSVVVPEIDPTVLALEMRLASVRERQGHPRSQRRALESYERIFDALSSAASPLDSGEVRHPSGSTIPVPSSTTATSARLVRIATKIGTLYHTLGRRDQAESWLLRAVELASEDRLARLESVLQADQSSTATSNASASSSWAFWRRSSSASDSSQSLEGTAAVTPTEASSSSPSLTRALISALLGLSVWYATPPKPGSHTGADSTATGTSWLVSLEEAVRVQSSALRLVRLERERLAAVEGANLATSSHKSSALHSLWVEMNEGTLGVHLAETLYGLQAQPQHRRKTPPPTPQATSKSGVEKDALANSLLNNRYILPLQWLHQSRTQTSHILSTLATPITSAEQQALAKIRAKRDRGLGEDARAGNAAVDQALPMGYKLRPEWKAADGKAKADAPSGRLDVALATPTFRLVRDANRQQIEIDRLISVLERKGRAGGKL